MCTTTSKGSDITVTETPEQVRPADPDTGSLPAPEATRISASDGPDTPAAKRGLNSMLLPELQQLARGMGISTARLKKSDLLAAIRSAQSANGSSREAATAGTAIVAERRNGAQSPASSAGTTAEPAAPADSPTERDAATGAEAASAAHTEQRSRQRQQARGAQQSGGGQQNRGQTGTERGSSQSSRDNQNRDTQSRDTQNRDTQNRDTQNRDNQNRDTQNRDNQNRDNQNRDTQSRDTQNRDTQNRDTQNRDNQNRDTQNRDNQNRDDDGDFDASRRRGRRYRDRRGRNRDRTVPVAGGNNDVEPTVSEDDVLVPVAGILDAIEDKNTWFVRTAGYFASPDDVYVANSYVRRFGLRRGDAITGSIRQARDGERREKYNPLVRLDTVNGRDPEQAKNRIEFTKLTPLYPQERLRLETEPHILTTRVIDLVMPIGKGQRALIVSPPKAGKTMVLQSIANAIATNNPEVHLMVVLVDERPEEVTDMQRSVKGEVIASTFDRRPQDHTMVAELATERAKRLVEMGHDVVVLLDSITRLGRAYNLAAPASGRILSGGVDSTALYPPKRFLGAARNIENGGSLTILATALVETGSAGDTVIFEEFKGTGNAELRLDRKIADKRVFPAVDVDQSSTRKEEILLSPDELAVTIKLRRVLHALEPQQAIDLLLDRLRKTRTNLEFLMQIAKTTPGQD
jgi:transcription termination factor Rho